MINSILQYITSDNIKWFNWSMAITASLLHLAYFIVQAKKVDIAKWIKLSMALNCGWLAIIYSLSIFDGMPSVLVQRIGIGLLLVNINSGAIISIVKIIPLRKLKMLTTIQPKTNGD